MQVNGEQTGYNCIFIEMFLHIFHQKSWQRKLTDKVFYKGLRAML